MSLPTLVGFLVGSLLFIAAVLLTAPNVLTFLNLPSLLIVVGGTVAAAFVSFEARYVGLAFREIWRLFLAPAASRTDLPKLTERIAGWGLTVKKTGVAGLEREIALSNDPDPFQRYGAELLLAGYPAEEVREMLEDTLESTFERETVPAAVLRSMASAAPAFGMVGTLVGLIAMLESMGGDAGSIGAGLAVALVTTLYGVLFARLVLTPAASKCQQRHEILRFRNRLVCEGFVMLAEKRTPQYIADRLNGLLDPRIRFDRRASRTAGPPAPAPAAAGEEEAA